MPSPDRMRYPNVQSHNILADEKEVVDLVVELFRGLLGWTLDIHRTKEKQIFVGESAQRVEIKRDQPRHGESHRWSIEIAERSSVAVDCWTQSGIFYRDNASLYVVGGPRRPIFVFSKGELRRWYLQHRPRVESWAGTKQYFWLQEEVARELAIYTFEPDPWRLAPPRSIEALPAELLASRMRRPGQPPASSPAESYPQIPF